LTTLVSGSPIIRGGKLVGALTHVLVNDPTTGYGIFIENMLNAAENTAPPSGIKRKLNEFIKRLSRMHLTISATHTGQPFLFSRV